MTASCSHPGERLALSVLTVPPLPGQDETPEVRAVLERDGRTVVVACPFCRRQHVHGVPGATLDAEGTYDARLSHCHDREHRSYLLVPAARAVTAPAPSGRAPHTALRPLAVPCGLPAAPSSPSPAPTAYGRPMTQVEVHAIVQVLVRPDGITAAQAEYTKVLLLDAAPVPEDRIIVSAPVGTTLMGIPGLVLVAAGEGGSVEYGPSGEESQYTFCVSDRYFLPTGRMAIHMTPSIHLAVREGDDENTRDDELWDRFDWGAIMQILEGAGFTLMEGSQIASPRPEDG